MNAMSLKHKVNAVITILYSLFWELRRWSNNACFLVSLLDDDIVQEINPWNTTLFRNIAYVILSNISSSAKPYSESVMGKYTP